MKSIFKSTYFLLFSTLLLLSSCTETLKENISEMFFTTEHHGMNGGTGTNSWEDLKSIPAEGCDISVKVIAEPSTSWIIQGLPDWLTATPSSGKGDAEVVFHAEKNTNIDVTRSAVLDLVSTIANWPVKKSYMVTQFGEAKQIKVIPDDDANYVFGPNGETMDVQIISNTAWKINCLSDFCKLDKNEGTGDGVVRLTIAPYKTFDIIYRSAYLEVTDGNNSTVKTIKVTQSPVSTTVNTQYKAVEISHFGGSEHLNDLGRVEREYTVSSSDALWLTVSQASQSGNIDVTISASANNSGSTRNAYAYVYLKEEPSKALYAIKVTQTSSFLIIGSTSENFSAVGGTKNVSVSSSDEWDASVDADWLSLSKNANYIEICASSNESHSSRSAKVIIRNDNYTKTIEVNQDAKAFIDLSSSGLTFNSTQETQNLSITTNDSWIAESNVSWLTLSSSSGTGNATITLSVSDNPSAESRTAYLTIKNAAISVAKTIAVSQRGRTLLLSAESLTFKSEGETQNVTVTTDASSSDIVAISSDSSWLTVGRGGNMLIIIADKNATTSERIGTVTVSLSGISDLSKTIYVTQEKGAQIGDFANSHEYVDLGLPSGIKWATCNVGASKPEEYGSYFAWGETTSKASNSYSNSSYMWCNGSYNTITKYCTSSKYGLVDNKRTLELADDAAYVNWGKSWRMPNMAELEELYKNCIWKWTTLNGIYGRKVIGPNGNSIFLPAAGCCYDGSLGDAGNGGYYWSSSLSEELSSYACSIGFGSGDVISKGSIRYFGQSVRAVLIEETDHEYVDLGLSVKWATCNVGASKPEEYGDYFAWGETKSKDVYEWSTYKWGDESPYIMTKYSTSADRMSNLELIDDAAQVNWGGFWRMPTTAELDELREKCTWIWTTLNGIKGYKVTSKSNGNSIFLPAAGYRFEGSLVGAGSRGYFWSSSLFTSRSSYAYSLFFDSGDVYSDNDGRLFGHSVRAVCP